MKREHRVHVRLGDDLAERTRREAARRGQTEAEYARAAIARAVAEDEGVAKRR